jgi:hypothetical protein
MITAALPRVIAPCAAMTRVNAWRGEGGGAGANRAGLGQVDALEVA